MSGNRRSGRRRIPTETKRLLGSKIRHDVDAEPKAPPGLPQCPPHIAANDETRAAWDALAARLLAQRVLTTAHAEGLALLADGWAHYVRLQRAYADGGFVAVLVDRWTDRDGTERSKSYDNPLTRQIRTQALLLNTLFGEFGQTPASAPKVMTPTEPSDPFDSFLSQGQTTVLPFPKTAAARRRKARS